jgi:N-acyl-D-aspartate/D-glutamate deacylase
VSEYSPEPALNERNVVEIARERGVDPTDLVLDLSLATSLEARFRMAVLNTDENAVAELLTHPATMLGLSDAGAHASQLCDACFSTHLLEHWVREKECSRSSKRCGCSRRAPPTCSVSATAGASRGAGGRRDRVRSEYRRLSPLQRVRDFPAGADRLVAQASGIHAVVVNGVVVREGGRDAVDVEAHCRAGTAW